MNHAERKTWSTDRRNQLAYALRAWRRARAEWRASASQDSYDEMHSWIGIIIKVTAE